MAYGVVKNRSTGPVLISEAGHVAPAGEFVAVDLSEPAVKAALEGGDSSPLRLYEPAELKGSLPAPLRRAVDRAESLQRQADAAKAEADAAAGAGSPTATADAGSPADATPPDDGGQADETTTSKRKGR